jgi:hypothetical protein
MNAINSVLTNVIRLEFSKIQRCFFSKKVHNVWKTFVIIIVNVLFISAINYLPQVFWVYFGNLRINKDEDLGEKNLIIIK